MTIADMRQVVVKLKINEMDILKLRGNMPVTVTVDAHLCILLFVTNAE